jgi:hypothetical protein
MLQATPDISIRSSIRPEKLAGHEDENLAAFPFLLSPGTGCSEPKVLSNSMSLGSPRSASQPHNGHKDMTLACWNQRTQLLKYLTDSEGSSEC